MKDFLENVGRYPRYLITIVLGILFFALKPLIPLFKNPITAIALVTAFIGSFVGISLILRGMLGFDPM
jgi:Protein of unknown function (DUF751)